MLTEYERAHEELQENCSEAQPPRVHTVCVRLELEVVIMKQSFDSHSDLQGRDA